MEKRMGASSSLQPPTTTPVAQPPTRGEPSSAPVTSSRRSALVGLDLEAQLALLSPDRDPGPAHEGVLGGVPGGPSAIHDGGPEGPDFGRRISHREARETLEGLLDAGGAPLSAEQIALAREMLDHVGKGKRDEWSQRLEARVASGEAEARLATLFGGLDHPITAAEQAEAEQTLSLLLDVRRPAWADKLERAVAWGAAETEARALLGVVGPLPAADIARIQALIAQLPAERQPALTRDLDLRLHNDPIEAELSAVLATTGTRLDDAEVTRLRGRIAALTNGKAAEWTARLDTRLREDTERLFTGDEASDVAARTEALSTLSTEEVAKRANNKATRRGEYKGDPRTRVEFGDDAELSKTTVEALGRGDYAANVEGLVAERSKTMNLSQKALFDKVRTFLASEPAPTGARAGFAELSVPASALSLEGVTLDGDLIGRMKRFTKFAAWAGLITGAPTVGSGVRSPAEAHILSTRYMFTSGIGLGGAGNRKVVADWAIANHGVDKDGNTWVDADLVTKLTQAKSDDEIYQQVLLRDVKTRIVNQADQAAEGYAAGDARRLPNQRPVGISNHCSGNAIDVTYAWVFSSSYDPMIDLLAAYFGLWRPVKDSRSSPEDWHYQKIGKPVDPSSGGA